MKVNLSLVRSNMKYIEWTDCMIFYLYIIDKFVSKFKY